MPAPERTLNFSNHDRDSAGLRYVYPVVSRRAGGVSVGVNLNPNNACNWRCVYCQVPELTRGGPPPLDLPRLRAELESTLRDIVEGDFMQRAAPEGLRRLNDVALSGNGEPTSAAEFPDVITLIGETLTTLGLLHRIKVVLITNGSLAHRAAARAGIERLARIGGEVWFKLDRATPAGMRRVNDTRVDPERHLARLRDVAGRCPTWVQSCFFSLDGAAPGAAELDAYLALLARAREAAIPPRGVLLYGLARPSLQPEALRLGALAPQWFEALAARIRQQGYEVRVTP